MEKKTPYRFFLEEEIKNMMEFEYAKTLAEIVMKKDDTLAEERIKTLQAILQRVWYYQERGMLDEIILAFFQKKIEMIQNAKTKGELQEISKPPKPVYNGNGFTPGNYDTEEEEMLIWSLTSLQAPLNHQAYDRYKELFCRLLPEKSSLLFPEKNERKAV